MDGRYDAEEWGSIDADSWLGQRGWKQIRTWHEPIANRRIPLAGVLGAVVATAVNVGVLLAARRWLGVPADESVLSMTVVVAATCGAAFVGSLVLGVLGQTQARPFTVFRRVAAVAFLVACAAAVLLYLGWLPRLGPISSVELYVVVGMNTVTAVTCVAFLTTMPRGRSYRGGF